MNCPLPFEPGDTIVQAHGGGGRVAARLLSGLFLPALGNPALDAGHDAGVVELGESRLALSTDSFVVSPWRFPGGDIGSLAVHGTVNDLAMAGARALALTVGFVLEEGFSTADLRVVVDSLAGAAREAGVPVVAGDTKVVERGKGDGIYLNTTGVGLVIARAPVVPSRVEVGDAVLVSGDLGRHGTAVMTCREGLELDTPIESDSACVARAALALIEAGLDVRCMRDATRGGLASVLNEIATSAGVQVLIEEEKAPVREDVAGVCELLGLDPLYVACEGRFAVFLPADQADSALAILRRHEVSSGAVEVGRVRAGSGVRLLTRIGVERVLDLLSGDQLPRIC